MKLSHLTPALATTIGLKVRGERLGRDAVLSIPTPDHYLPLLYVLATRQQGDVITFPIEGMDGGSISILAVQLGSSDMRSVK